ncbi:MULTISPECIES: DUF1254 domain-containing protein [Gordonia]|uniref:DUF1254 domain-containing protein n=1 Tax=Gordonia TaxID=2053 RepID=UPI0025C56D78|nr:DUF1254 domain-containing protein [Gordonia sp. UBA5067]
MRLRRAGLAAATLLLVVSAVGCGKDQATPEDHGDLAGAAVDAYVYGYPLVTMDYTRKSLTNTVAPQGNMAPEGQFVRMRQYPNAQFRAVTAPNADTLYTTGWFDVSQQPWVISVPDMGSRYFLLPILDGWTNVIASPGSRTTGGKAQTFAITGPGWKGTLPAGVTEYKSPTSMVWLLGRIYSTGTPADYAAVHAIQDKINAVPLSNYGKPYTPQPGRVDPAVDTKTAVREQVNALDGTAYFQRLAALWKANPPSAADAPMVAKMARLGLVPGRDFAPTKDGAAAIAAAPKAGQDRILAWQEGGVKAGTNKNENGWLFTTKTGTYGTEYLQRAYVTWIGLGANLPQDAVYPTSEGPALQQKYSGANKYVLRFAVMPPVKGFWSLTMYDKDYFFVDNPLNRYTLSERNELKKNADGSVDLYLQANSPGKDKESNWLPAPEGDFVLMLRMYWPSPTAPTILDGSWQIPAVKQVQ